MCLDGSGRAVFARASRASVGSPDGDLRAHRRRRRRDDRPARAAQRRRRPDGRARSRRATAPSRPTTTRACWSSPAPGDAGVLRRRRPEGDRDLRARAWRRRAARSGFTRADAAQADDRRDRRAGAWPAGSSSRCGATCGSPREGSRLGFPERRWGVPLIDGGTQRLPRIVGLGPRRSTSSSPGRIVERRRGAGHGAAHRGRRARARTSTRALEYAEALAALPAGDDARRPPRGDRGPRPAAGRRPRARGARPARPSSPTPRRAPRASPAARAAAARARASDPAPRRLAVPGIGSATSMGAEETAWPTS